MAFQHGLDWVVDKLEKHRQHVAAQPAYALSRGEHSEILQRAHQENAAARREIYECQRRD